MIQFTTTILQFAEQGEKTGWTYIKIPAKLAQQLKPGNKKSFRVKGQLDDYIIKAIALLPMGEGDFIMALNAGMRKGFKKTKGAKLLVNIEVDENKPQPPADLLACLEDEPAALTFFNSLANGHRNYFSNWIQSAKTEATRVKRIAQCVSALSKKYDYGQMIRKAQQDRKDQLG